MKLILFLLSFVLAGLNLVAQARLTIENKSGRVMTVKVMKGYSGNGILHQTVAIEASKNRIIYFSESGYYYAKTKAVLKGKEPIYRKGQPFSVTNDETGYSVLTLSFSIRESITPQITGGKQISRAEFDQN